MTETPPLRSAPGACGWLPSWFVHPTHLELDCGFHLRPLRAVDLDLDLPAVLGSRASLHARFGAAWGWPPADLDAAADLRDLQRQEREMAEQVSFSYGVLDEAEDALAGCVYLDPPRGGAGPGADVDVSWWTVDAHAGSALEAELPGALRDWLARDWPFTRPRFVGVDLSYEDWSRLAEPS
ncbi:N-acetyltransferase [Kineococcus sp. SYSU DK003]|uniref:N-acetyltransferase n=1 Tax=Kineococcus sp. SYSU DK003 TaxID=3383124 RepID=UPI003D7EA5D5